MCPKKIEIVRYRNIFFQDKASYMKLLTVLKDLRAFRVMGCTKTMSDFEQGILSALQDCLPWAVVRLFCLFHIRYVSFREVSHFILLFNDYRQFG
jgi:hypothetical protein